MRRIGLSFAVVVGLAFAACGGGNGRPPPSSPPAQPRDASPGAAAATGLTVSSTAFMPDGAIPATFTCDGADVSPPLNWSVPARGAAAYAIIVEDPDAPGGGFTHWIILDLPAETTSLPQGVPAGERPAVGGVQAQNDAGIAGYSGPCPPAGPAHHYRFTVYALDRPLGLVPVPSKGAALNAMQGHVLAQGTLVGTYQRAAR